MAARPAPPSPGRGPWIVTLAWLVLVWGLVAAVVSGVVWYRVIDHRNADTFIDKVQTARATVATEVRRGDDLLASLAGTVVVAPDLTNEQFQQWYDAAQVQDRFPGGIGVAYVQRVAAEDLAAFTASVVADPPTGMPVEGRYEVFPATDAEVYCLQRLGVWKTTQLEGFEVPAGFDYCAPDVPGLGPSALPPLMEMAAVSGRPVAVPPYDLAPGVMVAIAPVYRGGTDPGTPAGRRDALQGWVAASFSAEELVAPSLAAAPGTKLEVTFAGPNGPTTIVEQGSVGPGTVRTETVGLDEYGRWSLTVETVVTNAMAPATQGVLVAAALAVVSLLVFLLVWTLAGSRRRALAIVEEKTKELEHQALHDPLTGLPNRALLVDRAAQMVARSERSDGTVGALFIDLDDFKSVNDTLGHAAGDSYIRAVAHRLEASLRGADTVGRLGGDEFLVLVEDRSGGGAAEQVAERIMSLLADPIVIDGVALPVSCSIGVATGRYRSADALIQDADLAMYQAKSDGKRRVAVYEAAMHEMLQGRLELEWGLRDALAREQFSLVYQPTFDLRTGSLLGAEAFLRWEHPTRGVLESGAFLPIAQELGLVVPIGRWVLRRACAQAAEWSAHGADTVVAVELSAAQLDDDGVVDDVRSALEDADLPARQLALEVAADVLLRDVDGHRERLRALKELGVNLAVGDFGTGFAALGQLGQFTVDAVKLDRGFLAGLRDDERSRALVQTLIRLGRALDLETLSEGIEDDDRVDPLLRADCDRGEGFLYARPLPAEELERLLTLRPRSGQAT